MKPNQQILATGLVWSAEYIGSELVQTMKHKYGVYTKDHFRKMGTGTLKFCAKDLWN